MKVRSSTYTLVVELDDNPDFSNWALDHNGFPWEVVFSKGDPETGNVTMGIKPLRETPPTEVWELYPYDERLPRVMEVRIYDYMASIEALDVPIMQIRTHPDDKVKLTAGAEIPRKHVETHDVAMGFVEFSAFGFMWGPLPLSPMEKPPEWPFPAVSLADERYVTLTPTMGGTYYEVACGPLKINLPWHDGISFAHLLTKMSWEDAVQQKFPHGVRLMRPGEIDETQVSG